MSTRQPGPEDASDSLLARLLANHASFPVRESEKFTVHAASDKLLTEYESIAHPSDELTYAAIRTLRYLKRHRAAMLLMQRRRPRVAAKAREIEFYELELHYHGGERETADRLLASFLAAGNKLRPSWKKALDRIQRRHALEDAWTELGMLEAKLADRLQDIDLATHLPLLSRILPDGNEAMQVLAFVRDRLSALDKAHTAPGGAATDAFRHFHKARLIFACGFGWSGSGSVSAFLSQHRAVTTPFGLSELGFLQGRSGRAGILAFLQPGAIEPQAMKLRLARFCIESVVCLRAIKHHYSVLMKCLRAPKGRARALGALVDTFFAQMLSVEALADVLARKRILGTFIQRMLSVQGGEHILLNNVFMAPKIELVDFIEDAQFVVVERDARDQFVARRLESRDAGGQGLDEFETMITGARSDFQRIRATLDPTTVEQRLRVIRFEDFVRDPETRLRVLDWLGLPRNGIVPDTDKFDASVSILNAGIHQSHLSDAERAYVETHLGAYLP